MDLITELFRKFAHKASFWMGSPLAFAVALFIVASWALLGHSFGYSDSWQLAINTGTTIVTFLMVFLIQNTQNREARSLHLKIDELIRASKHARNRLIDLENLSEKELDDLHAEFSALHKETEERIHQIRKVRHTKAKGHHESHAT